MSILYNPLDYEYSHDINVQALIEFSHQTANPFTTNVTPVNFTQAIHLNNQTKQNIQNVIQQHTQYIDNLDAHSRSLILLWTDPNVCSAIQRLLRGLTRERDVETLYAIIEQQDPDNYRRMTQLYDHIVETPVNDRYNIFVQIIDYIYNNFVLPLTNVIINAPFLTPCFMFRGINGPIVARYNALQEGDFYLEHGFVSATWCVPRSIEYATMNLQNPPFHVLVFRISDAVVAALSVQSVSTVKIDREFLFPAGTLVVSENSALTVVGINQLFISNTGLTRWYNFAQQNLAHDHHGNHHVYNSIAPVLANYPVLFGNTVSTRTSSAYHSQSPNRTRKTSIPRRRAKSSASRSTRINGMYVNNGVVQLDMSIIPNTHDIVTAENDKNGLVTFFYKKNRR